MICWPCIIIYQYNETNVMHFSFSLLRIKGLYMFRALLTHPQEALHKQHLVYCVRTQYTKYSCWTPHEDEQVMLETCRGLWFSINWMKSVSRWFHYTVITHVRHKCIWQSAGIATYIPNPGTRWRRLVSFASRSRYSGGNSAPVSITRTHTHTHTHIYIYIYTHRNLGSRT
jgi:hypothetical protein